MQLHSHDPLARIVWHKAQTEMRLRRIPYERLLQNTNIWLGKNPRSHIRPTNRGYYAPATRDIVVSELGFFRTTTMGSDDMRITHALGTLLHEMGHMIHFDFLPGWSAAEHNPGLWTEWARVTGNTLSFQPGTYFGNNNVIRSFEDFANDWRDWILQRNDRAGTNRKQFYYSLWQQPYIAEVMVEIGKRNIYLDGIEQGLLDIVPRIENGRTILELRGIGTILGAEFDYEPKDAPVEKIYIKR